MYAIARSTAAVALVATLSACAATAPRPSADSPSQRTPTVVDVSNNNWLDVNVYVVRYGMRYRLGTVASMTERLLEVPHGVIAAGSDVQLMIDPIGSNDTYRTEGILVSVGDRIQFTVHNYLPISSYAVWSR